MLQERSERDIVVSACEAFATVRLLTYAGVCWRMLTWADVCWRMLTYAMDSVLSAYEAFAQVLLHYCFTTALLLLYYCFTARQHTSAGAGSVLSVSAGTQFTCFTTALLLLYYTSAYFSRNRECEAFPQVLSLLALLVRALLVCCRMLTDACWRVPTYADVCCADVCWRMLTYADVCWRMLTYANVCWRMLTCADECYIHSTQTTGSWGYF
jgi:hypothetical protein